MSVNKTFWGLMLVSMVLASFLIAQAPPAMQEKIEIIKQSLQQSQQKLRTFEWIETVTVSVKGEVKSQTQNRCYYGMDGALTKVPVTPPPQQKPNEKLTDYMQQAVGLVKAYVPPVADQIQKAAAAGNVSFQILVPGQRVGIQFKNYAQAGDLLTVQLDTVKNQVLSAQVTTYLGTPKDPVTLDIQLGVLNDGTIYATGVTLDAPAKKIQVTVANTGYRPM